MKFQRSVQTSDLRLFGSIKDAQAHELKLVIEKVCGSPETNPDKVLSSEQRQALADALVKDADRIVDILTTKETSRPNARKANGAVRKKRTPKTTAAPTTAPDPIAQN